MKKFLLSIIFVISALQAWGYHCKINDICYNVNTNNNTATVTYSGYPNNNDYIGRYGGSGLKDKDIVIPATITYNDVEYTVTAIGNYAFYDALGNVKMASVTIPSTVTTIGKSAFSRCNALTSFIIPGTVTTIGDGAFGYCTGLTSVTIEEGVTCIEGSAFYGCSELTSVTIPNSVIAIGDGAFSDCTKITSVTIPDNITEIGAYLFSGCYSLSMINIPSSVTSIGNIAFKDCVNLTSIMIPKNVTTIGAQAFYNCSALTSVSVDIATPLAIEESTFTNRTNATLHVPYGSKAVYQSADYWKDFKEIVETAAPYNIIEFADANVKALCVANWDTNGDGELSEEEAASVTSLGSVFRCNNSITSFDELKHFIGLNSIGSSAFFGCSGLTSITIPNSVNNIGDRAFYSCDNLSFVNIDISTPLQITQNTFSNRANATLQVPCPSKKLYQAADYWNEFKKIVEFYTPTDISQKDNAIYIQPRTVLHGKNFKVEICMKNEQPATAYSFDLVLPEGVTVAKNDNDQYMDVLSDRHVDHMRTINYKGDGTYSFAALSGNSELLQGNDGPIRIVTLHADDEMEIGDYPIVIQNARYSNETAESTNMDDTFITLTIEDFLNGDVNNDGAVDIADAVGIVNYIVGKTSANFEVKFADYNCDGYVDIADAVGIVNYIVGKNINKARRRTSIMREPQ